MIKVKNVSKSFGSKKAVDDISFEVEKGQVLGFLGPNGAGKSTTMRMITGFFAPNTGSIEIDGNDILENPIACKSKIGYLPENAPLYDDMSVNDFLEFVAHIRGFKAADTLRQVDKVLDTCQLRPVRNQLIDTLSKGYRHRTCLAQALIHDPQILILDEPTDGLDPNQKHEARSLISKLGEEKAIIFSTHILEEVDAACTRAIIIDRGKIVADGSPAELEVRARGAGDIILEVELINEKPHNFLQKLAKLSSVAEVKICQEKANRIEYHISSTKKDGRIHGEQAIVAIGKILHDSDVKIFHFSQKSGKLEDFFRSVTSSE